MEERVSTTLALFRILADTQVYFKRPYSWMSIETMRERLKSLYGIGLTYAGVRWQLKKLKKKGFLATFPQKFGHNADGTIFAWPPNRSVSVRGLRWMKRTGLKVAKFLWDHATGKHKMPRHRKTDIDRQREARSSFKAVNLDQVAGLLPGIGRPFPEPS